MHSKEIIIMLNHHGHCINYRECEQIDSSWTISVMKAYGEQDGYYRGVVPSNINPGQFVESAAHDADFLQDIPS